MSEWDSFVPTQGEMGWEVSGNGLETRSEWEWAGKVGKWEQGRIWRVGQGSDFCE